MTKQFEVQLSPEFLERIEEDVKDNIAATGCSSAFQDYNRGGGPGGSYDRHYDRSTGKIDGPTPKVIAD